MDMMILGLGVAFILAGVMIAVNDLIRAASDWLAAREVEQEIKSEEDKRAEVIARWIELSRLDESGRPNPPAEQRRSRRAF